MHKEAKHSADNVQPGMTPVSERRRAASVCGKVQRLNVHRPDLMHGFRRRTPSVSR